MVAALWAVQPGIVLAKDWDSLIAQGVAERRAGNINGSIDVLSSVRSHAEASDVRARAAGELGASLVQARRHEEADGPLSEAYYSFSGAERARYALDLGNLSAHRKRWDEARRYYREAAELGRDDPALAVGAALNLARLEPEAERRAALGALPAKIEAVADPAQRARYYLNLGSQARLLGPAGAELAYRSLERARTLAAQPADGRLAVEALDMLAQLYEDRGQRADALALTEQALDAAQGLDRGAAGETLVNLEWRRGRLMKAAGKDELALAAYQRAVENVEAIRQDIPIEYEDGRSSFRATLEPVYLGLVEMLFRKAARQSGPAQSESLHRVRDVVELIKQSELQDFLGDRCEVEAIHRDARAGVPTGVAVLYPVILPDRTELLLETEGGIAWRTTKVEGRAMRATAIAFAKELRNYERTIEYREPGEKLYRWLLAPFESVFTERQVHTLVVVPDGALRLVSMGALHDGKRFAIQKFAIATVTGLTMTNADPPSGQQSQALVAGMADPGPVVEKLSARTIEHVLGAEEPEEPEPATEGGPTLRGDPVARSARSARLRAALSLPGVKDEMEALGKILRGSHMLDSQFTVKDFQRSAGSGDYRIVHIASHGVFGGSADASYIMAYDDLLTMNGLQALLKSEQFRRRPIELLTLSACETAEGDDRSPLGISGAAIKARAKSVLGTLWPVEDTAARFVMESFYKSLTGAHASKARALQQAQIELMQKPELSHPFFWAPFILIGNWL